MLRCSQVIPVEHLGLALPGPADIGAKKGSAFAHPALELGSQLPQHQRLNA